MQSINIKTFHFTLGITGIVACLLLPACSFQTYHPQPLTPQSVAGNYTQRRIDSADFKQYLINQGYSAESVPMAHWGLNELTLSALFFHPELAVSRAQWRAAMSSEATAAQSPLANINTNVQHHSVANDGVSPWTYGLGIDLPIETAGKKQARIDRARFLSEAARIEIAQKAWEIRKRLKLSLLDYAYSQQLSEVLQQEITLRSEIVAMLEKRLSLGAASSIEVSNARLLLQKAQQSLSSEQGRQPALLSAVINNAGLPAQALAANHINYPIFTATPAPIKLQSTELQAAALQNRLDIRANLARYAAAEAKLKLEIAKQYPDVVLSPAYSYDQGDNIWSLGVSGLMTLLYKNQALIAEAKSLREVEASQFFALQSQVMNELSQAQTRYQALLKEQAQALQIQQAQRARTEQSARQFNAGYIDRLEFATIKLENLLAAQYSLNVAFKIQGAMANLEDVMQMPLDDSFAIPEHLEQHLAAQTSPVQE
jgi:outer membrane protein, heavy metal efflux system